ncbi:MAG: hypothetical protein Q9216_002030 [Gyalolechia sp. 2 TL-2023]
MHLQLPILVTLAWAAISVTASVQDHQDHQEVKMSALKVIASKPEQEKAGDVNPLPNSMGINPEGSNPEGSNPEGTNPTPAVSEDPFEFAALGIDSMYSIPKELNPVVPTQRLLPTAPVEHGSLPNTASHRHRYHRPPS